MSPGTTASTHVRWPKIVSGPSLLFGAAAASILVYFFVFAGPGLRAGFTHDDLMNMYGAWRRPAGQHLLDIILFFKPSPTFRPLGALFYKLMFERFGFDPFPFRVACYALLVANFLLTYVLVRRLTASREIAFLTVLLHAYHGEARGLYLNTGICYDILCFLFYTAALAYYLWIRQSGHFPRLAQLIVWSSLYILCLDSKEMAVTLPVMILLYEVLTSPPRAWHVVTLRSWLLNEGRVALLGGVLTFLFIAGRIVGPDTLTAMDSYRPVFSLEVYLDRARNFLAYTLYNRSWTTPAVLAAIVTLMAIVSYRSRLMPLRFGFLWMIIGILPVAFIHQRGLDAVWIAALGFALFLASGLVAVTRRFAPSSAVRPVVLFIAVLVALIAIHGKYGRFNFVTDTADSRQIMDVYQQIHQRQPVFPLGSRILFLQDPIPEHDYASTFIVYLLSRDLMMHVYRLDRLLKEWPPTETREVNFVFTWSGGRLLRCDAHRFSNVPIGQLPARACISAGGG
jgi:hypothetical protein